MFCCCSDADGALIEQKIGPGVLPVEDQAADVTRVEAHGAFADAPLNDIVHYLEPELATVHEEVVENEAAKQDKESSREEAIVEAPVREKVADPPAFLKLDVVEFKVDVGKDSKNYPIAVELDAAGGVYGMVISVGDGSVSEYNKKASPIYRVQVGDFIIGVNGVTGDTKRMAQLCIEQVRLEVFFRRVSSFCISVDKTAAQPSLGLDLDYLDTGISLHIQAVTEGLVMDWNRTHAGREVHQSDRIIGINGYRGSTKKLLDMCANLKVMELEIVRPSYSG